MKTIYKYQVPLEDAVVIYTKQDSQILDVQFQNDALTFWFLLDNESEPRRRYFRIFGTGWDMDEVDTNRLRYLKTLQVSVIDLVWHIFEEIP